MDAQTLSQRDLCGEMSTAAEPVDAERAAWRYRRADEGAIADDACAE
jgi:hypothetical protein